jgi:DNA-binding transcriptional MerR regulator
MIAEPKTPAEPTLTIQEMAAQSGLSEHTLRYYERIGLLRPIPRHDSSGHRRYPSELIAICEKLACLRGAGMSIEDMREHLRLVPKGASGAAEQKALFAAQEAAINDEIETMQIRKRYLAGKVAYFQAVEDGDTDTAHEIAGNNRNIAKELAHRKGKP